MTKREPLQMIDISDFYVNLAGVSGTLLGTFMVGAFFYLDSEMHRRAVAGPVDDLYVRSGVRWALLAYSLPVFVSLTLSSLDPGYGLGVFAALSVLLLAATVATARRMFVLENDRNVTTPPGQRVGHDGRRACHRGAPVAPRRQLRSAG